MSWTAIRVTVGRVVLVAGILILLFIPYLLWGTGLMTARSQSALRSELQAAQQRSGLAPVTVHSIPHRTAATGPNVAATMADPPVGSPVGTLDIPKIGLSMVVVEGTDEIRLQQGPGHYPGTPLPGEAGNAAVAGHRTTYLHPFYNLNELLPGDPVYLSTVQGLFRYDVLGTQVVAPTDVSVVDPTSTPQLTLTTCNPRFSASQRLVVHAELVASVLAHPTRSPSTAPAPGPAHRPALPPPARSWPTAILWALAVTAVTIAVWTVGRRAQGGRRYLGLGLGLAAWLAVVFLLFQAVAPLLPASY